MRVNKKRKMNNVREKQQNKQVPTTHDKKLNGPNRPST
ncbi:spore protein [Gracilibacillus sp. S3-1-1]|uniref:Spore protein n=1 Tax=Gracilibacillus pellucidus TaxID=3095368 RepID=A0ACC6M5C5_9BACI|nr:spore protein [Gracilibacillus sp. S3-1-1]MDX8046155.1 spore protein [Gracilibacillus sp. S3-1-1]